MIQRRMMCLALVLCLTFVSTGCEPLRKKFTRKKKKSQVEDVRMQPVLEPEEYPDPTTDPMANYKDHYALVKVFYRDLWLPLQEHRTVKNSYFAYNQVMQHLDEMRKMIKPEFQGNLDKLKATLAYYEESLKVEPAFRNRGRIESDLREFDRQLRRSFKPDLMKDSLIAPTPNE